MTGGSEESEDPSGPSGERCPRKKKKEGHRDTSEERTDRQRERYGERTRRKRECVCECVLMS